ncbi:hypothetical protein HOH51_01380 [bacterium]|jgi:uncharacterized metal-binding protein YceD (DUF177 family)|nr:hypothetical protein [bacterium]
MTKIKVYQLLNQATGQSQDYTVAIPEFQDPEFQVLPKQTIVVTAYRVPDGLSLSVEPQQVRGQVICSRSLENFIFELQTKLTQMQAYPKVPKDLETVVDEDFLLIESKNLELDLEPLIRESIFLSLPLRFVNPKAPKHPILNAKQNTKATNNSTGEHQPFAKLKELL